MNRKILLIEDDMIMRENTAEILELAKYNVITACNGREGVESAQTDRPDLIISDIMMPELDGYGVLHVLSKDPKTSTIPFIFFSAKAEKSEQRKGMELGADDYITKPFENTELLNAIEARLRKSDSFNEIEEKSPDSLNSFLSKAKGVKELDSLSGKRTPSPYKKKEIIFHAGDVPHSLYFIHSGKVKLYKSHNDGKELITNVYKEGEFFGYNEMFEDTPYKSSALVLEDSQISKIPKKDFIILMNKNRDVANKFIKLLSNYIEEQEIKLLRLAYDSVRKRTAEALLNLYDYYNLNEENQSISVSREDLASLAGTATETVIRCLGEFKQDGIIATHGREIVIIKPEKLREVQ